MEKILPLSNFDYATIAFGILCLIVTIGMNFKSFRFVVKELIAMYSGQNTFFSKKRIESGVAFIVLQWGMVRFLHLKIDGMTINDMLIWAGLEAAICGYALNKIQEEKKLNLTNDPAPDAK